jgi:hypothetical protein
MKPGSIPLSTLALTAIACAHIRAGFTASADYDEQAGQTNTVDFSMAYSANATWTTGIGQTLGAAQILNIATFEPLVESAAAAGNGGVIDFDAGTMDSTASFTATFATGTKSIVFTSHPATTGSYNPGTDTGSRTPISGNTYLARSGSPHYDLELGGFTGFNTNEKVTAIAVTVLGRNGTGANSNWRVIGFYTNGTDSGSSSTFRSINTNTGNAISDSFAAIQAPPGYWITRIRIHSDNNVFTSIDDLAFVTSTVDNPPLAPSIVNDLPATREAAFGSTVNLAVTLNPATSPPPTWQWQFDAAPEDSIFEPVAESSGGNNATLSFTSGSAAEGTYKVTATNNQGTVTSGGCVFRITPAIPLFLTDLSPLYEPVAAGSLNLSVTVNAGAYPIPTYQWFFGNNPVSAANGGNAPTLTLTAGPATDGDYRVEVTNSQGSAISTTATVAHLTDTDGDTLADIWETNDGFYVSPTQTGTSPNLADTDGDGLGDAAEINTHHTDPNVADSDADGLNDGQEINIHGTNALVADTDGDGINDGPEVSAATNPLWYNGALEWRPGGIAGGSGSWDATTPSWFDGGNPPGTQTTWSSSNLALFPNPVGTVGLSGNLSSPGLIFKHNTGIYNLDASAPGDSLALTGGSAFIKLSSEARLNLPVSGSFTVMGPGTLRLTADNTASLAGATITVASGQVRPYNGTSGNGFEIGDSTSTVILANGSQIRFFNVTSGPLAYPQSLRIAGNGIGANPGALNNDCQTVANNITWSGDIILDDNATIGTQNQGTWTLRNINDGGTADKILTLTQQANSTTITGTVQLGGLIKTAGGTLVLAPSATTSLADLIINGGLVRLNAPNQLAPATKVFLAPATILDLNGFNQTFHSLEGSGTVTGAGTTTVTNLVFPGNGAATLTVNGALSIAGAIWQIDASGPDNNRINVSGDLNLNGASLDIVAGTLTGDSYILASYGTLAGAENAIVSGVPEGYSIAFNHNSGTQIALLRNTSGFDAWAAINGVTGGPTGDSDNDGVDNLVEYALDTNINGHDPGLGSFSGNTLSFTKRAEAVANGDVSYAIEISTTLAPDSWTAQTSPPATDNSTTISFTLPTGQGRVFARLRIVR